MAQRNRINDEPDSLRLPSCCERLSVYAHRLYYSKAWSFFYSIMFITNIVAIISLICVHATGHAKEAPGWLLFIEVLVNLLLILELGVRMIAQQGKFFKEMCNVFDFIVMIVCIVMFIVYWSHPLDKDTAIIGSVVLAIRYAVVFARMIHITIQLRGRANQMNVDDVDFTLMADEDNDAKFGDDF
jgi:hypothetical protein